MAAQKAATEKEYQWGTQGRGKLPPRAQSTFTMAGSNSATKNTTIQETLDDSPGVEPQTKTLSVLKYRKLQFVKPEVPYREPTSSKMKVEDLVTVKQKLTQTSKRGWSEQHSHVTPNKRYIWDRPIPKPQYVWPYDPHMPTEWNEAIASMQTYEGHGPPRTKGHYRQPEGEEILPSEHFNYQTGTITNKLTRPSSEHPRPGKEATPPRR
jgi:hypothetical protein